ncbi:class I SAM-dependent methyltransferase [Kitasatospora sp. McL0602]|uniref:class I SAM-dependent methyltransferase n=1 Tax=Kitasatospora sp. McL0602 TaxID=3439530 RepID=UPI003F8AAD8A
MLNYDDEAASYDRTRGGDARAEATAEALETLLPPGVAVLADLACGTGIVTTRLRRPGREVIGVDLSPGMAALAAARLPGRIQLADATRLPLADASVDAAVLIWLLHLLDGPTAQAAFIEAARILRPGGALVTTVDKNDAAFVPDSDVADLIVPVRAACTEPRADALPVLTELATRLGLARTARTTFAGLGQGRSPRAWRTQLLAGRFPWTARTDELPQLCARLQALPDQDRPRPDPVYQLVRFTRPFTRPDTAGA